MTDKGRRARAAPLAQRPAKPAWGRCRGRRPAAVTAIPYHSRCAAPSSNSSRLPRNSGGRRGAFEAKDHDLAWTRVRRPPPSELLRSSRVGGAPPGDGPLACNSVC